MKLLAIRAQRELRQQQLTNSREQTEFITKRVATGETAAVDATLTELETQQLSVEPLQLETSRAALLGELRPLLGLGAADGLEITGSLAAPGGVPARGATGEGRADLGAARHTAEAARQSAGLARAQKWQDVGAGLTASGQRTEDAPEGFSKDYFLGIRLSVPLPFWNKNEGRIAESDAAARRAQKEIDALTLGIRAEAEAARTEMAALAKLVAEMGCAPRSPNAAFSPTRKTPRLPSNRAIASGSPKAWRRRSSATAHRCKLHAGRAGAATGVITARFDPGSSARAVGALLANKATCRSI